MSNNGEKTRLEIIEEEIKALEPKKDDPEARKKLSELYAEKVKLSVKPEEVKDFKIAEIWIKNDTVALDVIPGFWNDKLRALGILEYCKEIVKNFNPQEKKIQSFKR